MAKGDHPKFNMSVDLQGRTALVTGAGSGIGLAIASILAGSGARVLINDIVPERAEKAASSLPEAEAFAGDIVDPGYVQLVKNRGIDILVNNAGFQHVAPLEDFPPEIFRRLLEVMLVGPFLLSQAVVPGMRERGWGRIVNISSVHGKYASAFKAGYVSAKHGMLGLTRVVALETATDGITCNAICPGYADTPLVRNQLKDLAATHNLPEDQVLSEVILRPVPQKRLITPEEIGYMAAYLCSEAAASITAQAFTLDGGWLQI